MKNIILLISIAFFIIGCKPTNKNSTKKTTSEKNLVIANEDAIKVLTEFYTEFYGKEYRKENNIENYVSSRILNKIDSLQSEDIPILNYDPFIQGQDWDENTLLKSLEIKPLQNKNEYRVSLLLFKGEQNRQNIDLWLQKNNSGKLLIYSILNDEFLNFKTNSLKKEN